MPQTRTAQTYRNGALIGESPYEVPDETLRREAAEAGLRGVRAAIRADIAEAVSDRDAVAGADLAALRGIVRRLAVRQIGQLRRERHALLVGGLDGDDGQD